MKNLLQTLGFIAFIVVLVRLLFHPKHWWKTWLVIIGLSVYGSYMKDKQDKLDKKNYDHTPGYVYFQRTQSMNNWK